ncbi:MAG: AAA family ATPase [Acidimicrobiales bacterium]
MIASDALATVVAAFVDDVTRVLVDVAPTHRDEDLRSDVVAEAFDLTVAFIDADGRHTDNELWALAATFGPLMPDSELAGATPAVLRNSTLVAGRAAWLTKRSTLFDILVTADGRDGGDRAMAYYRRALDVCHHIASLDQLTSQEELQALGAYRTMLLDHIRSSVPVEHQPELTTVEPRIPETADPSGPPAPAPPDEPARPLEELLAELDALVGLTAVKDEVRLVTDLLRVQQLRAAHDLPNVDTSLHMVFVGNPGTGKTTVARLLAQIYRAVGALPRGHLVETDRSGMVAGFVGQTAPMVVKRFDEADGGMLFIDEAYTLVRGGENDFGREAIDQMVKLMEDRRDRVAVVIAGYPEEMAALIAANPGLESRFPKTISFPDYSTDELVRIFQGICDKQRYEMAEDTEARLRAVLEAAPRGKGFGNGRFARNLFEAAVSRHASRVAQLEAPTDDDLQRFHPDDIGPPVPAGSDSAQLPSTP